SYDQTVFYVTIESHKRHVALNVIIEMMGFPTFDPSEIDNERGVVIEEIKRGEDSLGGVAWKTLFETVYKKHSYKTPIIGFEKNIKSLPAKKIKKFFESRYVPSNMFLVVAGDFDSQMMKKEVTQYFGEFKPFKLEKRKRAKEPIQKTPRVRVEKSKFKKTQAYLAWPVPNVTHKDVPALDLLALILGTGDSSRLSLKLRLENLLTQSVGAFSYSPLDPGVFAVSMNGESEKLIQATEEAFKVLNEIVSEPPTTDELKKALAISASEGIYAMETVDGLSRKAGSDEFYYKDPEYYQKYLKQLYSVKPEQITKIARKYLTPEKVSIVYLTENVDAKLKGQLNAALKKYKIDFAKAKKNKIKLQKFLVKAPKLTHSAEIQAETKISVRPSGIKLITRYQKGTPTFSLRAAVLGGIRFEKPQHGGVTELLSRTWTTGSKNYSEAMINHITESVSAGLGAFGGRNTMGLTLDGLSPNQKELLPIFFDVLGSPTFEEDKVEREKSAQINQIKNKKDNPAQVCFQRFHELMFKNHPYSRDVLGTAESLQGVSTSLLKDYHQQLVCGQNLVICVVGDFDNQLLEKQIENLEKQISKGKKVNLEIKTPEHRANEIGKIELDKEQTHIVLGYQGLRIDSEDRYALDVMQSVLSGQGGRLFLELRDKNSLAYSVSPVRMEGIEAGYFGTYIGCSPEKSNKAIQMMRDELKKLMESDISDDELIRAKNYLIGQQAISLQKKSSIAQAVLLDVCYGQSPDHIFQVIEEYKKITKQQVKELAKKIFSQPEVLVVAGPVSKSKTVMKSDYQKET
ncbi:MAG: M16 family metallopeptidase, partial [Bdellovibrionales bacterium]